MKKCKTIEEGIASAIEMYRFKFDTKWNYLPAEEGDLCDKLILNGEEYPFFWWRGDTQISGMTGLAPNRKPCSFKLNPDTLFHNYTVPPPALWMHLSVCTSVHMLIGVPISTYSP